MSIKPLPSVVLVGRPNVGKSTLFNRLLGTRRAIVTAIPGTTRDVLTHTVRSGDQTFDLTDTGGMFGATSDALHREVVARGQRAIASADLVVFVVDGREGLVPGDQEIAQVVRGQDVPVILAVNKTDDRRARAGALELFQLGFDPIVELSAEHGQGVGDLTEEILARLPATSRRTRVDPASAAGEGGEPSTGSSPGAETAVVIVGRPNSGKSSLVNRLLREERMIVSDEPGTTRDPVDTVMKWHRRQFRIVDTAGIRRPGRVASSGPVEAVSVLLARRAIEQADVVVLVIDASVGATEQDAAIAGAAQKAGRGIIIAANKWDLMKSAGPDEYKRVDDQVRGALKFVEYAPILHLSAKSGERTGKLLEMIDKVTAARRVRVPTAELNRFIEQVTSAHRPVSPGHRHVRVLYAAQTGVAPPTFVLFTNVATKFHFSYERFLENRLRERYGFVGTPLRITVRKRARRQGDAQKH
ncbi:MAG: ribosome biogenesis GTPase Der [Acidobacteriota bacterium]